MTRRVVLGVLCVLPWMMPQKAYPILGAADVVHDPLAYIQHLQVQINTLRSSTESARQTISQIQMLANQAESLKNQVTNLSYAARNIKANPFGVFDQISSLWNTYNATLNQAQGISYNLAQSTAQFDAMFPQANLGLKNTVGSLAAQSAQMLDQIRAAGRASIQSQALYTRLCEQQALSQTALASAKSAEGALAVGQANAQLQAITTEQLASIQQLMASQGRLEASYIMAQTQADQNAKAQAQQWCCANWPTAADVRGPHQGQGPTLPQ